MATAAVVAMLAGIDVCMVREISLRRSIIAKHPNDGHTQAPSRDVEINVDRKRRTVFTEGAITSDWNDCRVALQSTARGAHVVV
jgi:hypothetical protein